MTHGCSLYPLLRPINSISFCKYVIAPRVQNTAIDFRRANCRRSRNNKGKTFGKLFAEREAPILRQLPCVLHLRVSLYFKWSQMSPGHVIKYCAYAMRDGDSLHAAFAFPPLLFLFSITRQLSNCFPPFSIFLARFSAFPALFPLFLFPSLLAHHLRLF